MVDSNGRWPLHPYIVLLPLSRALYDQLRFLSVQSCCHPIGSFHYYLDLVDLPLVFSRYLKNIPDSRNKVLKHSIVQKYPPHHLQSSLLIRYIGSQ